MSLKGRAMAAINAWRTYGREEQQSQDALQRRYSLLGSLYTGTWRADPRWPWQGVTDQAYRNSRQIVKTTGAIVDLYEQLVYAGDLSTDGRPLPDGTRGAIPIDPQTGNTTSDAQLQRAFHELFAMWQWRMWMSVIPKTAAIFGDVLVELIYDAARGEVVPNIVYPGYVPSGDLELDEAGNVKAYAIEYPVSVAASTAFGRNRHAESYVYRKEVDGEAFRYYRDGKPFAYPETGPAEQDNPYGFVPACWERHELVVGSDRGMGAYERTIAQAIDLNSTLSSATDYQRKQFGAPILVKGSSLGSRAGKTVTMPGGVTLSASTTADDIEAARRAAAESLNLLPVSDQGGFETIQFDIGQTMQMVEFVHDKLIAENPEAQYGQKLAELKEATGPGVRMQLAPIIAKVEQARKNHDPQTIKRCQMGTAIIGHHLNTGDIPSDIVAAREARYEAFRPFSLDSYGRGMLDATIPTRDVFPESQTEKATRLILISQIIESGDPWLMAEVGVPEEQIARILTDRAALQEAREAALERRFNAGLDQPDEGDGGGIA